MQVEGKFLKYCTKCKKEGKKENLRGLQSVSGDPINPSGQVHSGSWFITLQVALGAHGFLSAQGFIHFLFSHALNNGHSSLS